MSIGTSNLSSDLHEIFDSVSSDTYLKLYFLDPKSKLRSKLMLYYRVLGLLKLSKPNPNCNFKATWVRLDIVVTWNVV